MYSFLADLNLPWPTRAPSSVILEGDCHQRARSQLCQVVFNPLNITPPGVQVRASVDLLWASADTQTSSHRTFSKMGNLLPRQRLSWWIGAHGQWPASESDQSSPVCWQSSIILGEINIIYLIQWRFLLLRHCCTTIKLQIRELLSSLFLSTTRGYAVKLANHTPTHVCVTTASNSAKIWNEYRFWLFRYASKS